MFHVEHSPFLCLSRLNSAQISRSRCRRRISPRYCSSRGARKLRCSGLVATLRAPRSVTSSRNASSSPGPSHGTCQAFSSNPGISGSFVPKAENPRASAGGVRQPAINPRRVSTAEDPSHFYRHCESCPQRPSSLNTTATLGCKLFHVEQSGARSRVQRQNVPRGTICSEQLRVTVFHVEHSGSSGWRCSTWNISPQ